MTSAKSTLVAGAASLVVRRALLLVAMEQFIWRGALLGGETTSTTSPSPQLVVSALLISSSASSKSVLARSRPPATPGRRTAVEDAKNTSLPSELFFGNWNVRGLENKKYPAKKKDILLEAAGHGVKVLALTETKGEKTGKEDFGEWKIFSAGGPTPHTGVAVAVHQSLAHLVTEWHAFRGGRVIWVDLQLQEGQDMQEKSYVSVSL